MGELLELLSALAGKFIPFADEAFLACLGCQLPAQNLRKTTGQSKKGLQ